MSSDDRDDWEARVAAAWADETIDDQRRIEVVQVLADEAPHPALGEFELGGAYDSGGHEVEADRHYTAATAAGLDAVDPDRAARMVV